MKPHGLSDARLIPDDRMGYLRKIATQAVKEKGYSPEDVTYMLSFSRSGIYDWLNRVSQYGHDGLDTKKAPGAPPMVTKEMDYLLKTTILNATPEDLGYDAPLWTGDLYTLCIQDLRFFYNLEFQRKEGTERFPMI
ncbi:MAG: hypothetical protein WAT36_04035, partial [Chromatiaceae bacterium]